MSAQPSRPRFRPSPEDIRPLTTEELRQIHDHDWLLRDPQRLKQYAGKIVAVYNETVWGVGRDDAAVFENATETLRQAAGKPGTPSIDDLVIVVVPDWFTENVPTPVG